MKNKAFKNKSVDKEQFNELLANILKVDLYNNIFFSQIQLKSYDLITKVDFNLLNYILKMKKLSIKDINEILKND